MRWEMANAANTTARWASMDSRCGGRPAWPTGRAWTSGMRARCATAGGRRRSPGRFRVEDIGDVGLPAGQRAGFGFEIAVDRTSAAGQGDEPVPFDLRLPGQHHK